MRKWIISILVLVVLTMQFSLTPALADWQPPFPINSDAVYLINADTNTVVYTKNADKRVYPASLTKMMTAILAVEKFNGKLNTPITMTYADIHSLDGTQSSTAGLKVGETLTVHQLLQCLLIESANETANALARTVGGNTQNFVSMMNQKAKEIGAVDTHFVNPHGLPDSDHYTTAYDIYLIARYAMSMKDGTIADIVSQKSATLEQTNKHAARTLTNTNKLLSSGSSYYYRYCKGIKTGTTDEAGYCLASCAIKNGATYYCVAMGAPEKNVPVNHAFTDTRNLYQWVFKTFETHTVLDTNEHLYQTTVLVAANNADKIWLYPDKQLETLVPFGKKVEDRKIVLHAETDVVAPIKIGQKLGTADVYIKGEKVGTVGLIANEAVARSNPAYFLYVSGLFFSSFWFKLICTVLVILFIGYISLTVHMNHRKKESLNFRKGSKKYQVK